MQYLRRISTKRLLALAAATFAVAAGGTAIALAATSGGPTPAPKPLAQAVHDAAVAPHVAGVTARIHFTNRLVDTSSLGEGADPVLTGADGRLWASADGKLRLELQAPATSGGGDSQVVLDGTRFTVYDAAQRTAYTGDLPRRATHTGGADPPPTLADIQKKIAEVMEHATLSGAEPSDVAGRAAYTVRVSPRRDGGLLGGAELAWDAANGVPLRAAVYADGDAEPILELRATDIDFGKVDPSVFEVEPPADAKVVDLAPQGGSAGGEQQPVEGTGAVQAQLPFRLTAPDTLAGRPRTTVRLISSDEHPAALVTYGRGLDGLAVIETAADRDAPATQGDQGGLSLPSVTIGSATGNELATALGTAITFERDGVRYVVLASAPRAAVEAAAKDL